MPRPIYSVIALSTLTIFRCAIDLPEKGSAAPCAYRFNLADGISGSFRYAGALNGNTVKATAKAQVLSSAIAPSVREVRLTGTDFFAVASLSSASLGLRTIQTGNPEFHIYAYACSTSCATEKFVAGDYSGALRGSGTLEITGGSGSPTQITLNATLPAENTSVAQTMQFQSMVLTETCQ